MTKWFAAVLCAAGLGAFAQVATFTWVWDDKTLIRDSPLLTSGTLTSALTHDFWALSANPRESGMYRPVVTASYFLDRALFGTSPTGPHLVNLLLHVATAGLVLLLARRLNATADAALFTAALYALHPVTAEAVANIASRTDLLALLFMVAAFVLMMSQRHWLWAAPLALLAMLSKETALTALPIALALEWSRADRTPRRWARTTLVFAVPVLITLALRFAVLGRLGATEGAHGSLVLGATTTLRYLALVVWPTPLVPYLPPTEPSWLAALGLSVVVLGAVVLLLRHKKRNDLAGLTWALLALAPVAGWLPVNARFSGLLACIPLVGLALALGPQLARMPIVSCAGLVVAAGLTGLDVHQWQDDVTLWKANVEAVPTLAPPHLNAGNALVDVGRRGEAKLEWQAALDLAIPARDGKTASMATFSLANLARDEGHPDEAEAQYRQALKLSDHRLWQAGLNLALLLRTQGRSDDAMTLLEHQWERTPMPAVSNLRAELAQLSGDAATAKAWYLRTLSVAPGDLTARKALAQP